MTSVREPLYHKPEEYKRFLQQFILLLEDLLYLPTPPQKKSDPKFLSQLRLAERTFNFFLDNYPPNKVSEVFGYNEWTSIKKYRDDMAGKISRIISSNPEFLERYQLFCDNLKEPSKLGSFL